MFKKEAKQIKLVPLESIGSLLSKTWDDYKKDIGLMLFVFGIAPAFLILFGTIYSALIFTFGKFFWVTIIVLIFGIIALITAIYFACLCQCALYLIVKDKNKYNFKNLKGLFTDSKKTFSGWLATVFWLGITVLFWALIIFIPGIIISAFVFFNIKTLDNMALLSFSASILLLFLIISFWIIFIFYGLSFWVYFYESLKGRAALKRSRELVYGYGLAVAWRLFVITAVPYLILKLLFPGVLMKEAGFDRNVMNIFSLLMGPFLIIYAKYLYLSLVNAKKVKSRNI